MSLSPFPERPEGMHKHSLEPFTPAVSPQPPDSVCVFTPISRTRTLRLTEGTRSAQSSAASKRLSDVLGKKPFPALFLFFKKGCFPSGV